MANHFTVPYPQFLDSTALPYVGGNLYFYETGTTTPADTYSDSSLATPNTNPVELDSYGKPATRIFLDPATTYKVVLKDADDNTIWTADPVVDPAANVTAAIQVYNGDPNGNVAGNAGSVGGTGASMVWDISSLALYVCTTTGDAPDAVWTSVGAVLTGAVQFSGVITPSSLGSNQNDYNPTSLSTAAFIRQNLSANVTITGVQGGAAGRILIWKNISAYTLTFSNENTSSTAAYRFALDGDLVVYPGQSVAFIYDTTSARWTVMGAFYNPPMGAPGGRLTLTTAVPVLTSDVTAAATVYYTPYLSNYVPLYNGYEWYVVALSADLSQALSDTTKSPAAAAVNSLYDMFVWNDAGTIRCTRGPAWSSATARGSGIATTELERVNGRYVNRYAITNGPGAQKGLYVGTIATNGSTQLAMMMAPAAAAGGSANRLDVWNMYNRVRVPASVRDSTNSWSYTTATFRSANNSTSNRVTYVCGFAEDAVEAIVSAAATNGSAAQVRTGIGIDSTSAISGLVGNAAISSSARLTTLVGMYKGVPGIGQHYVQWLEHSEAAGTTTWYGDDGAPTSQQQGLQFSLMM